MKKNKIIKLPIKLTITILFVSSLTMMAGAIISPSLPNISKHFLIDFANIKESEYYTKLLLSAPALTIAILGLISGTIVDKFGRIKLLIFSLILYCITGTMGLYLNDLFSIIISRIFLGASISGIMTSVSTLVADYFKGELRVKYTGYQGAFMALGGTLYIGLGGLLADIHWRGPFSLYFLSLMLIPFVIAFIKEPKNYIENELDKSNKIENNKIPYLLAILVYITTFILITFFYMMPLQIPFLLKILNTESNSLIGLVMAVASLFAGISSTLYPKIKRKFNYPTLYVFGAGFMALGYLIIGNATEYFIVMLGLVIMGIGNGIIMPNGMLFMMQIAPFKYRGRMLGLMSSMIYSGQFMSPIIINPIIKMTNIHYAFIIASMGLIFVSLFYLIFSIVYKYKKKTI